MSGPLLLHNALLADGTKTNLLIDGSSIVAAGPGVTAGGARTLDAGGRLLLPAFVNPHLHACKCFWSECLARQPAAVRALPRFEAALHVKRAYTPEDTRERVGRALRLAIRHGTCALRLFCDVDDNAGLRALEGMLAAREDYRHLLHLQVAAFPQDGLDEHLLDRALAMGADLLGGIPWTSPDPTSRQRHIERLFALARDRNVDLHFVADDTTDTACRTLEAIARATIDAQWQGRVHATQAGALAFYPDAHAREVIALVREARMTIVANGHVSLVTTPTEPQPSPRGLTRVRELLRAGIPVAIGQDDIDNWYYPFGNNDMLEVAFLAAHAMGLAWGEDLDLVRRMASGNGAALMGITPPAIEAGAEANLVILDAPDWREALRTHAEKSLVILRGHVAARSSTNTELAHLPPTT